MTTELQTKKPRAAKTPRQYDSILKGALSLGLQEKADLVKALKEDMEKEVAVRDEAAKKAKEIVNGL